MYTSLSTKYNHLKHTYLFQSSIFLQLKIPIKTQDSISSSRLKPIKLTPPLKPHKIRYTSLTRRYNHLKHNFLVQPPFMAFNSRFHLGLLIFFILTPFTISFILSPSPQPEPKPTIYDILTVYGLPGGIFPDTVESYNLDKDGNFEVFLKAPCYVEFEYLVYYAEKISGKLGIGSITELEGIEVKRFLFWFNVKEIRVDLPLSDSVYFQIGFVNKKLDIHQFETIHSCMKSGSLRQVLQVISLLSKF